jgi:hypothetical protein
MTMNVCIPMYGASSGMFTNNLGAGRLEIKHTTQASLAARHEIGLLDDTIPEMQINTEVVPREVERDVVQSRIRDQTSVLSHLTGKHSENLLVANRLENSLLEILHEVQKP